MTYHVRLNEHGAVELPAALLAELGVRQGEMLTITRTASGALGVKPHAEVVAEGQRAFRAMLKQPFTVDDFIEDRRREAEQD